MIQDFWIIDYVGLLIGRLILSFLLFLEFLKNRKGNLSKKFIGVTYLILSIFIFLGYYSSFTFILLIILETFSIIFLFLFKKREIKIIESSLLKIALSIVFIFVGPGFLSLDRILNIRFKII